MRPNGLAEHFPFTGPFASKSLMQWLNKLHLIFRPSDGWAAVSLLFINLMIVVWSVDTAEWVDTPNLVSLVLLAMVTGLIISRIPVWPVFLLPIGVVIGGVAIVWKMVEFKSKTVKLADSNELWDRLELWLQAAQSGSINIDPVPFAFAIMSATWLSGLLGVWLFARHGNFWGVFVLGGAGLLSNLTYLPPKADVHLGLYLFTALLLVARVQSVRRRNQWRVRNVGFDNHLGVLSISDSFFMGMAVLLVAFFVIPEGNKWQPTNAVYEYLRKPMVAWENDFNRLFAGLPARRALGYRIWGDVMPFQGTINPTDAVVLQVESRMPMYWKARTYNTYTPKGWKSDNTELQPLGWTPSYTNTKSYKQQLEISYVVIPNYETQQLFGGGQVQAASRDVRVETYDAPQYIVDLTDPGNYEGLPSKLVQAAEDLVNVNDGMGGAASDSSLAAGLPMEFRLVAVDRENGIATKTIIAEAIPPQADVVSVRTATSKAKPGHPYELTSSVSLATPRQLRMAGEDYPTWAQIKYTGLPNNFPQRVRALAGQLTASSPTAYDKAKAIEQHLQSMEYTLEVDPPPFNADGIDHFLFTLRKGYSEYFSSAMTVMLRSQGIPARMVTGYTTGNKVKDQDVYIVTDSHSHGWVEVFFPDYGWIPFEPTPGAKLPPTFVPGPLAGNDQGPRNITATEADDDCSNDLEDCELETSISDSQGVAPGTFFWNPTVKALLPWILAAVAVVALAAGTSKALWWKFMEASPNPSTMYRRLGFLGTLNSASPSQYQTPYQYGSKLEQLLPSHRENLSTIIGSHVQSRYSKTELSPREQEKMLQAWLNLRIPLLLNALRRKT